MSELKESSETTETTEAVSQTQTLNETVETAPEAAQDAEALTFDDLDNLVDGRSDKELVSEAKKEVKTSGKENKSQDEGLGKDETNQVEKEASKKDTPKEEVTEEEIEDIKKLIAKYGDEELEIASNALFKHKVDGEDVDVSLQDLLNNYSGKVSYDKKFQEFSSNKKELEDTQQKHEYEIGQINEYINNFATKIKEEDALGALEYFAEFSGMKPYEFRTELIRQIAPEVERRSIMSPEEVENENLRAQNEYLIRQQESETQYKSTEQAQKELGMEIKSIQEAHGISDEDFESAYYELTESGYDGNIDPATVAEYYTHSKAYSKAESVLSQVDSNLTNNDQVVESFQKVIVENPSFDDNDLLEIVQDVYGGYKKEASKKVSKKLPVSEKPTKKSRSKEDFVSFEDF
ncbi:MAG: hypothetical protein Unbinned8261contig1001_48 [Prokaryotic dsDNA virus sp.]|nr:MAG: hypothetical protein Unbinned8261contig1001_48 [Prokaryotic dsDNA virus sp.]